MGVKAPKSVPGKVASVPRDPNSPAYSSGTGNFQTQRRPGSLGLDDKPAHVVLASAAVAPAGAAAPAVKGAATVQMLPPPATVEREEPPFRKELTDDRNVELNVEILRDAFSSTEGDHAETTLSALPEHQITYATSGGKVSSYKFVWKGTLTIQTTYPTGAKAKDPSVYGRGTGDDEATGHTSLGFHESCHRQDFLAYIERSQIQAAGGNVEPYVLPDSQPPVTVAWKYLKFPSFNGHRGQKESDFKHSMQSFKNARLEWERDVQAFSKRCTDEFGLKKSAYLRRQRQ
jgi:hypothetical protein